MTLLDIWNSSKDELTAKHIHQIISVSGSGKLKDNNDTSNEFRDFLSHVPSDLLERYAIDCLNKFEDSGLALQDIVNELGRRLGFDVEDGRYRGIPNEIGYDGIWTFPSGHSLVVEVKTTDAYRMTLDTVADYRKKLIQNEKLSLEKSSILIVVGREDTGDLESQTRGSRHNWDIRIISLESLIRLMKIKEDIEDPQTLSKISEILIPEDYTRVDRIIDLVFSTTEDIKQDDEIPEEESLEIEEGNDPKTKKSPVKFHSACIERIQTYLKHTFIKQSRVIYETPDKNLKLICMISKDHERTDARYWFAFHPYQKENLEKSKESFVALGCGSDETILLIPLGDFKSWLNRLWTTERDGRFYWHVRIGNSKNQFTLNTKKGFETINLDKYVI